MSQPWVPNRRRIDNERVCMIVELAMKAVDWAVKMSIKPEISCQKFTVQVDHQVQRLERKYD